ncbi:MAG: hypothetical protein Q9220_006297 [cf. Caloplaca sp. 1 TL-2023]
MIPPSTEALTTRTAPAAQDSSCSLDPESIAEQPKPILHNHELDAMLDSYNQQTRTAKEPNPSTEEACVQELLLLFAGQRAAVATSLAQLYTAVEKYDITCHQWLDKVDNAAYPFIRTPEVLPQLAFLGQGIGVGKTFESELHRPYAATPILQLSTVEAEKSLGCPINVTTFYAMMVYGSLHNANSKAYEKDLTDPYSSDEQSNTNCASYDMPTFSPPITAYHSDEFLSSMPAYNLKGLFPNALLGSVERDLIQQTEARLGKLQVQFRSEVALIDKHQRKARDLKEEINHMELSLGIGPPEAQTQVAKPPDQLLRLDSGAACSPDATTLVENPNEALHEAHTRDIEMPADLDDRSSNVESRRDLSMEDPVNEHDELGKANVAGDDRKRKRWSKFMSAKKARTSRSELSNSHHPKDRESQHELTKGINPGLSLDDDTKPPHTLRPISWPRSRLFRRSAGVSVKKLTEVFEKLNPYQSSNIHMD